ncbi:hypothetical protein EUX98_g3555 [Antrodiella citrinella]|uniref:YbgI/family dinuclear metal center protein n=1 Tax=Antrodiella citrinella TaxID=2447956 RepID=A0A4S4MW96_9APHY|nr:hypothetical protein EUX98_g3555 [Antrodiella citrinella]
MAVSVVKSICRAMEAIAPLRLAEKWDNVGLLLESPIVRPNANRVLLTIDLTEAVTEEALASPTSFIVSYHPTIFKPLTSLTLANPLQSNLLRCAAAGISVYCPHTSLDNVSGGINDWLGTVVAGKPTLNNRYKEIGYKISVIGEENATRVEGGSGRIVTLPEPISMSELEWRIKSCLELEHIQVGYPHDMASDVKSIRTVAICAGSGESVLLGVDADAYFTGEMTHHSVLAAVASGHFVVLCGHTNTERGYLPILAHKLKEQLLSRFEVDEHEEEKINAALRSLEVHVSEADKHPLRIV